MLRGGAPDGRRCYDHDSGSADDRAFTGKVCAARSKSGSFDSVGDPDLSLAVATNLGVAHHVAVDHDASVGHQEGSHFHRETAASGCWKNFLGN